MRFLIVGAVAGSIAAAQDGTCVRGVDPLDQWQECLGRCHIFYAGDYGACGHQFSQTDANGACGDSLANRCYSTFNAAWSDSRANCGNCYYVEMSYDDGTVTSTYLETVDTNGSETKFEMSEAAWINLCPFACAGTGVCAHSASQCQYGVLPDAGFPAPCAVQSNSIRFKRVDCNGGTGPVTPSTSTTTAAVTTTTTVATTTTTAAATTTTTTTATTTTTTAPAATSSTTAAARSSSSTLAAPTTTTTAAAATTTTTTTTIPQQGGNNDVISQCKLMVGYPSIDDWDHNCKLLCDFYGAPEQKPFCPYTTAADLAACVKTFASYCIISS